MDKYRIKFSKSEHAVFKDKATLEKWRTGLIDDATACQQIAQTNRLREVTVEQLYFNAQWLGFFKKSN